MKNEKIRVGDLVPPHIRKRVYLQAIKAIEKGDRVAGLASFGLCLILPCLLWDLEYFLHNDPKGHGWDGYNTPYMFPELTSRRVHEIESISGDQEIRNKKRILTLNEMLAELETLKKK